MATEMEVIVFPCVSTENGEKNSSSGKKASCHFALSCANYINKNIGLCKAFRDRRGVLHYNVNGQFFCGKALSEPKNPGEVKVI